MISIKGQRAAAASKIGQYPTLYAAMRCYVPEEIAATLSARQIGVLVDAIWRACERSKEIALADAVQEGAIWDESTGRLLEIGDEDPSVAAAQRQAPHMGGAP